MGWQRLVGKMQLLRHSPCNNNDADAQRKLLIDTSPQPSQPSLTASTLASISNSHALRLLATPTSHSSEFNHGHASAFGYAAMDKIRVSKVEDVTLWRRGIRQEGNLHLMPHHIVFSYFPPPLPDAPPPTKPLRPREVWVTYPMIVHCALTLASPSSSAASQIRLRCRDFTFFCFHFASDRAARDVYESIRALSCKLGRLDKLLAFTYQPKPPEDQFNGWDIYDARREYKRLGISPKDSEKGWRVSELNKDYKFSPTYPALLVVPTKISDNVLNYAGQFRSRQRIPVLVYRHPINNCSITRSSQPQPGLRGNRNPQDEKLVAAIFATNSGWKPAPTPNPGGSSPDSSTVLLSNSCANVGAGAGDADAMNAGTNTFESLSASSGSDTDLPRIYGAQQRNMIVDARPTVNAMVMQAVGQGSEKMEYYPNAEKAYLGIDNIHVMRKSLNAVADALKDSDFVSYIPATKALANSGWLKHIDNILRGTNLIAHTVGVMHSHVLIHCSDGWDRTSQLSALSQLCLDPYYRTLEGFMVLVEKDWLSFGHMFRHRSGFLGSDKWFEIENERIERRPDGSGGGNPFENAIRGARGLFNRENRSSDSLSQAAEMKPAGEPSTASDPSLPSDTSPGIGSTKIGAAEEHRVTKVNELSPVFHQFLDATYQLMYQYPTRFEFNERFLRRLLYHLYSCQYGTFLFDNEKERVEARAKQRTRSVWDYFLCRKAEFTNPDFDPVIDDGVRGRERMIFPQEGKVRWWAEAFGRPDGDMNPTSTSVAGTSLSPPPSQAQIPGQAHRRSPSRSGANTPSNAPHTSRESTDIIEDNPIVTGTETASKATGAGTTTHPPENLLPKAAEWSQNLGQNISKGLAAGIVSLGIKESSRSVSPRTSTDLRAEEGKEMSDVGVRGAGFTGTDEEVKETNLDLDLDPLGVIPLGTGKDTDADSASVSTTTDMGEAGRGSSVRREVAVDMQ